MPTTEYLLAALRNQGMLVAAWPADQVPEAHRGPFEAHVQAFGDQCIAQGLSPVKTLISATPTPILMHQIYRVKADCGHSRFAGKEGRLKRVGGSYPNYFLYLQFPEVTEGSLIPFLNSELEPVRVPT